MSGSDVMNHLVFVTNVNVNALMAGVGPLAPQI